MYRSSAGAGCGPASGYHLRAAIAVFAAVFAIVAAGPAQAVDEIQVYNAEIAKVGQWTMQQHFNYAINGLKDPDFPGAIIRHHALNGTPELAYGVTDWWELGFYMPYAVDQNGQFWSDGAKLRTLFVSPDAEKRSFFYGVNFEFSYSTPKFSETKWNAEVRPILGWRKDGWAFIINPIIDLGFGAAGDVEFEPAARLEKKFNDNFTLAAEYYTALGPIGAFPTFNQQEHNIYGVVDFKVGKVDVDFGVGYGLTPASDRWMTKMILSVDLNEGSEAKAASARASRVRMAPSR